MISERFELFFDKRTQYSVHEDMTGKFGSVFSKNGKVTINMVALPFFVWVILRFVVGSSVGIVSTRSFCS